jgi:hypothetical protein
VRKKKKWWVRRLERTRKVARCEKEWRNKEKSSKESEEGEDARRKGKMNDWK